LGGTTNREDLLRVHRNEHKSNAVHGRNEQPAEKTHRTRNGYVGFTAKYNIDRIVYYETYMDIHQAIAREKEIKGWRRSKKIALIESTNPNWTEGDAPWLP